VLLVSFRCDALNYYAAMLAATGERPCALLLYEQACAMNHELIRPEDEAVSLEGIGEHHLAAGDPAAGIAQLHQALEIYHRLGLARDTYRVQTSLTDLAARDGVTLPRSPRRCWLSSSAHTVLTGLPRTGVLARASISFSHSRPACLASPGSAIAAPCRLPTWSSTRCTQMQRELHARRRYWPENCEPESY
jgi:hypothetical protein